MSRLKKACPIDFFSVQLKCLNEIEESKKGKVVTSSDRWSLAMIDLESRMDLKVPYQSISKNERTEQCKRCGGLLFVSTFLVSALGNLLSCPHFHFHIFFPPALIFYFVFSFLFSLISIVVALLFGKVYSDLYRVTLVSCAFCCYCVGLRRSIGNKGINSPLCSLDILDSRCLLIICADSRRTG